MKKKAGERTLLTSVLLSSPGPIVIGIGLIVGRSSTQIADFIRRTSELAAIIVSWIVYRILENDTEPDPVRREKLERTANSLVGAAMCLSGVVMLFVALFSSSTDKGNVIPGLVIAILGVIANTLLWLRYRKLNRESPNAILAVQSRLYRTKSLVDVCVTIALAIVAIAPGSTAARVFDLAGSIIVAVYLVMNGVYTLRDKKASGLLKAD